MDNTYALVKMPDGSTEPVQILWLFDKVILVQGPGTEALQVRYMHVRTLRLVTTEEAFGGRIPCMELLIRMRISFASRSEDGEELVVPFSSFVAQLAVVPFDTDYRVQSEVYGLKAL